MQLKLNYFILILCCFIACEQAPISQTELLEKELNALTSNDLKRAWLEEIQKEDQAIRKGQSSEILLNHGKDSKEYKDYNQSMNDLDALNLLKVEGYVKKYGHPKKSELGEIAAGVFWLVVHHSNTYEERERNFEIMYQAFLDENIDDGAMSFYLGRMFQMKNGYRHEMKSPYRGIDEINQLIELLDLKIPE